MPYGEFLEKGKAQLPEESFRQAVYEIGAQRIEAELILVGYMDDHFVLFQCADREVTEHSDFIAIGSGAQIAAPVLYQREQNHTHSVEKTVYAVHEAKKLAEIAPGVGRNTTYTLLRPPKDDSSSLDFDFLSPVGKRELEKRFLRFGPKKTVDSPLPGDFWI